SIRPSANVVPERSTRSFRSWKQLHKKGEPDMRQFIITLLMMLAVSVSISAQSVYTPERGTPERAAILDTLRVPVERKLKQKIVFVADHFNVSGPWAFVSGSLQ